MVRKVLDLFGYVRTFVIVIVLAAVAGALSTMEVPPLGIGAIVVVLAFLFWKAPFGAKYRKNF